jgi:hypothetical protein
MLNAGYRHAIEEFIEWYCSEPRLSFNRTVVLRYRMHLESRKLAPGTINLRLGAVRRLAFEASDSGLLSADLAAGIRRVKGVKVWTWALVAEESRRLPPMMSACRRALDLKDRARAEMLFVLFPDCCRVTGNLELGRCERAGLGSSHDAITGWPTIQSQSGK